MVPDGSRAESDKSYDFHGYGIQDQRQAMLFVQRNIATFGGNPDQVGCDETV